MIVITQTRIDRPLTTDEEMDARQFMSEYLKYMAYIDQSDPTNIICHWTSNDVADKLIAKTASYSPPLITTLVPTE